MDRIRASSSEKGLSFLDRFIQPAILPIEPLNDYQPIDKTQSSNYQSYLKFGLSKSKVKQEGTIYQNIESLQVNQVIRALSKKKLGLSRPKKIIKVVDHSFKLARVPFISDDFYLNILDWSSSNLIAAGLKRSLFCWPVRSDRAEIMFQQLKYVTQICSVKFDKQNLLGLGFQEGAIKIYDVEKRKEVTQLSGHVDRVCTLDWNYRCLLSGSKDGFAMVWDLRTGNQVQTFNPHTQQVSGGKWNPSGKIIATGSNDNKVNLYDFVAGKQLIKFSEHKAAIKALDWCPENQCMLAAGGGSNDRHIRFFNSRTLKYEYSINTQSQICNLAFSKISSEMVTTHGYSMNEVNTWRTNNLWNQEQSVEKVGSMMGHLSRVLYLAMSPDGETIATGAGDKTIRFWKPFENRQLPSCCLVSEGLR